jgi:hypothetical protein
MPVPPRIQVLLTSHVNLVLPVQIAFLLSPSLRRLLILVGSAKSRRLPFAHQFIGSCRGACRPANRGIPVFLHYVVDREPCI